MAYEISCHWQRDHELLMLSSHRIIFQNYMYFISQIQERAAASATFGGTEKLLTNAAFPFRPSPKRETVGSADELLT